jgi:Ca2+-binding RTX toxin-like protein
MAILNAYTQFSITALDFYYYIDAANDPVTSFDDNSNLSYDGTTYADGFFVTTADNFTVFAAGSNLQVDEFGDPLSGVVRAIGEDDGEGLLWALKGIVIDFQDLFLAALTPTLADDFDIIGEALSGNDSLRLSNASDRMYGFDGNDTIFGYGGRDILLGDDGNDKIFGGTDSDQLLGGNGDDYISGSSGDDRITGGNGADDLYGGSGEDTFVYGSTAHSGISSTTRDYIFDFRADYDVISLSTIDANTLISGNQRFLIDQDGNFVAGEIRLLETSQGTVVQANVDGDSSAEMSILVVDFYDMFSGDFIL